MRLLRRELLMLPASFRAGVIDDVLEGASAWDAAVAAGGGAWGLTDWVRQAGVMLRAGRRRLGDQRSAVIRPAPARACLPIAVASGWWLGGRLRRGRRWRASRSGS